MSFPEEDNNFKKFPEELLKQKPGQVLVFSFKINDNIYKRIFLV